MLARDPSGIDLLLDEIAAAVGEVRACWEVVDSFGMDYRFTRCTGSRGWPGSRRRSRHGLCT